MMPGAGAARPRHGRIRGGYEAVRACAAPARPAAVDRRRAPEPKDGRVSKRRKTPQSPRAAAVGLQALLAAVFALIIVTVVGGLVWTTYRETAALSSEEATARFDALASTVAQRLRATFDPGLIMLDALAAMPLGRMEPLAAGRVILAIMQSDARRSPAVAAVQIGRDDGTALIVGRLDDDNREVAGAVYVFKVVTAAPDGLVQRTYHLDEQGRELAQTDTTPSDFDARNRPWYTASVVTPETITTPPYRYIGQRNIIGVTLARRATSEPGIVYGIDITLKRLSGTLTALKRSSGRAARIWRCSIRAASSSPPPKRLRRPRPTAPSSTACPPSPRRATRCCRPCSAPMPQGAPFGTRSCPSTRKITSSASTGRARKRASSPPSACRRASSSAPQRPCATGSSSSGSRRWWRRPSFRSWRPGSSPARSGP
ncbi:hypothetical protein [Methylobacterium organophilum]|uniref:hypothetical protein n=1 Tax=Methylobacterium organophilum TaxID=410 RepID=UPI001EE1D57F|nr:hypothetical protein [Methylobacterium organophilum]